MSSFAAEKVAHLSFQLNALLASSSPGRRVAGDSFAGTSEPTSPPSEEDEGDVQAEGGGGAQEETEQARAIKAALAKLDLSNPKKPITTFKLLSALSPLRPPPTTITTPSSQSTERRVSLVTPGEETLQWALVSQTTLGTYSLVLSSLIKRTDQVSAELDYWREVESTNWTAGKVLIQTLPTRGLRVGRTWWERWKKLAPTTQEQRQRDDRWRLATIRRALLPPSLLLTSAFPHLASTSHHHHKAASSSRSAFFLTLSPLLLTRQEAALKKRELEKLKDQEAERIGDVAEAIWELEKSIRGMQAGVKGAQVGERQALTNLVSRIESAISDSHLEEELSETSTAFDVASSLHRILSSTLPSHLSQLSLSLTPLSRPSWASRAWPFLVAFPLTVITLSRLAWRHRSLIQSTISDLKDTVRGFFLGWVVSPLEDIFSTIKAGDKGTLAIMSDESLKSDLASLERMVADFGRDRYRWDPEQVRLAELKVREGDLTEVLRAWEQEIKTPFRSAVGGSLIRALLIQGGHSPFAQFLKEYCLN